MTGRTEILPAAANRTRSHTAGWLPRLLAGVRPDRALSLDEHHRVHGPRPRLDRSFTGDDLIRLVAEVGLCGRGGAGYPLAKKLAKAAAGRRAIVVANGAESEPASRKDATLLAGSPHLVLDGAVLERIIGGETRN